MLILIRMKMYSRGLLLHFKREISNHFPRNFPTANSEQNYCPHISFKKRHFNRHLLLQFAVFQTILKLEIGKFGNWIFLFTYELFYQQNSQGRKSICGKKYLLNTTALLYRQCGNASVFRTLSYKTEALTLWKCQQWGIQI